MQNKEVKSFLTNCPTFPIIQVGISRCNGKGGFAEYERTIY